mmetsp:Transcript_11328/g.12448  ORF Transcript_11328/g.12448 Transcript_11328/m.12448 type:complete len:169 (+) Transcript_11328:58-564(+)
MVSRGVWQLKNVKLFFSDVGGSSKGIVELLESGRLDRFAEMNKQLNLEVIRRRSTHPFLSCEYINGYIKDVPLRNLSATEAMGFLNDARSSGGHRPLAHRGSKVVSNKASIQGKWKPNIWGQYPQFQVEKVRTLPRFEWPEEITTPREPAKPRVKKDEQNTVRRKYSF